MIDAYEAVAARSGQQGASGRTTSFRDNLLSLPLSRRESPVHPTAKRCVQWAIVALVIGTAMLAYGPNLFAGASDLAGANAAAGLGVLNFVLTVVSNVAFPLGAALVGAAVVIQALAPPGAGSGAADTPGRRQGHPRSRGGHT